MEAAIKIPQEIIEAETTSLTMTEQAKAITIANPDQYVSASELWKNIRAMREKVGSSFDPLIKHAHALHKATLAKKAEIDAPLEVAEKTVKKAMNAWDEEQERIRQEEQRRLQEEARKREEEARLAAAIEAEQAGAKEEAEQILEEPVYVAPVVVQKQTPKVQGGPVFRTVWKHQVTDLKALVQAVAAGKAPLQALKADDVFLGQQARSLKDALRIPGVKTYSERV